MRASSKTAFEKVGEFHAAFGHPRGEVPSPLRLERKSRRIEWLEEEISELRGAESLVDQVDAVIDLLYFAYGTMVELGVDPEVPFGMVHQANMNKLGPDGCPIISESGKILKPFGWVGPENEMQNYLENLAVSRLLGKVPPVDLKSRKDECLIKCCQILWLHFKKEATAAELNRLESVIQSGILPGESDVHIGLPVDEENWNASGLFREARVAAHYARCNYMHEWDFEELIERTATHEGLAIVTLSAGALLGHNRADVGHAVVLSHIDEDSLVVFDTAYDHFGYFRYSREHLISAIRARLGGIVTLTTV